MWSDEKWLKVLFFFDWAHDGHLQLHRGTKGNDQAHEVGPQRARGREFRVVDCIIHPKRCKNMESVLWNKAKTHVFVINATIELLGGQVLGPSDSFERYKLTVWWELIIVV